MSSQKNLRWEIHDEAVAVLIMDVPGESVNTLKATSAEEFEQVFDELERNGAIRAVVFASAKQQNFLAGADISILEDGRSANEISYLSRRAQRTMDRIERFSKPVVAAIHGSCLGGGVELALACHARVATDDDQTRLGMPEVQLGLLPAAGGTQRLPALIGVRRALELMLTGRQLRSAAARRIGLVDEVVSFADLLPCAVARAKQMAAATEARKPTPRAGKVRRLHLLEERVLSGTAIGRRLLFAYLRKRVMRDTKGNYPAPLEILRVVRRGLEQGFDTGLEAESSAFGALATTPEARALIGVFRAQQELRKEIRVSGPSSAPQKIHRVTVVGGGAMGTGIAHVIARKAGLAVCIKARDIVRAQRAIERIRKTLNDAVRRKRLSPEEADRALERILPAADYSGLRNTDLVIEAVNEDLELKRRVLREVEEQAREGTIFASTTSALPISQIAKASRRPENVIGMHYFSPVDKMPLLEVVTTDFTAPWVTRTCVELGRAQDKTVIVVADGPGFYTTRILAPFINEALFVLEQGVPIQVIDAALTRFGYPVGPLKLLDEVGVDVAIEVNRLMAQAFGERMPSPAAAEKLAQAERFGRKNGRGFYRTGGRKAVDETAYDALGIRPTADHDAQADIALRITLRLVNEAAFCFGEGILKNARDGDVGAIFGLGFPPFRGGPFRFVDAAGAREVVAQLEELARAHGQRFAPAPVLIDAARSGASFYGDERLQPGTHPSRQERSFALRDPGCEYTSSTLDAIAVAGST